MTAVGIIHGETVAKALVLLDQANTVLVRIPIGGGDYTYLGLDPKSLRAALAAHPLNATLPSKYNMNSRVLKLGCAP